MAIAILEVPYASPLYEASKVCRQDVLRTPIGLILSDRDVAGEDTQIHIAATEGEEVVGTVILKPLSARRMKLRQMAVRPRLHGQGVGQKLVKHAEAIALQRGYSAMELSARLTALGFYKKLGYETEGETFEEVSLPTIKMIKTLQP